MKKYPAAIIASGCMWGFMGLFRRYMGDAGISSAGVIIIRCGLAAVMFAVTMLAASPGQFKVRPRDFWCFFGSGVCGLLFFTYCYFQAMTLMSLSAAAILLYTAPSIVTVMSLFIFGEKLTPVKITAVALAFIGCALVSGLGGGSLSITAAGILYGLGSGFGYALYSIFAKLAIDRGYSSNTVNFYSCLLAAAGAALIWGAGEPFAVMTSSWENAALCAAAAIVTCYLPYLLYTYGLTGMETGRASVMASVEPVVATLVGIAVFRERLTLSAALGMALVLSAIVILNFRKKRNKSGAQQLSRTARR